MAVVTGAAVASALGVPSPSTAITACATAADELLEQYLTPAAYATPPAPVAEAGIAVAIDILQSRTAAGGQPVGVDGNPGPYRMGPSLLARVSGLIGPWLAPGGDAA